MNTEYVSYQSERAHIKHDLGKRPGLALPSTCSKLPGQSKHGGLLGGLKNELIHRQRYATKADTESAITK